MLSSNELYNLIESEFSAIEKIVFESIDEPLLNLIYNDPGQGITDIEAFLSFMQKEILPEEPTSSGTKASLAALEAYAVRKKPNSEFVAKLKDLLTEQNSPIRRDIQGFFESKRNKWEHGSEQWVKVSGALSPAGSARGKWLAEISEQLEAFRELLVVWEMNPKLVRTTVARRKKMERLESEVDRLNTSVLGLTETVSMLLKRKSNFEETVESQDERAHTEEGDAGDGTVISASSSATATLPPGSSQADNTNPDTACSTSPASTSVCHKRPRGA